MNTTPPCQALVLDLGDGSSRVPERLLASITRAGFGGCVLPVDSDPTDTARTVAEIRPELIALWAPDRPAVARASELVVTLRRLGCRAHLSLCGPHGAHEVDAVLHHTPQLDSVSLGDGEPTLVALLRRFRDHRQWLDVPGLALRFGPSVVVNPIRGAASEPPPPA